MGEIREDGNGVYFKFGNQRPDNCPLQCSDITVACLLVLSISRKSFFQNFIFTKLIITWFCKSLAFNYWRTHGFECFYVVVS